MKSKSPNAQDIFIQKLKEALPPSIGIAEELAELLDISIDSAYRRIRGETDLSIKEVQIITKKYGISLDSIFSNLGDTVTFTYTKLTDSETNFKKYLNRIYNHLKSLSAFPDRKLYYVAEEVPIFYSFFTKQLTEFKLFYWQRSVLNIPEVQNQKFEFGKMNKELIELANNCYIEYKKIPSVEIWTTETINTAIRQIEFYLESGVFKNVKDTIDLLEQVKEMAIHLGDCALNSRKEKSDRTETFQLYSSDVVLGTNCIYAKSGEVNHAYISFNSINSLTTNNKEFCDETEHWIKNIIRKSTLISGAAEKQRFQFFNQIIKNIDASLAKISS
ncbi:MAG: helix-turn-helix domain-containing protein [Bacteroidota bacterium]|nr:helix-turn-helix domain-containing protein [Bacteroidota bacterium]